VTGPFFVSCRRRICDAFIEVPTAAAQAALKAGDGWLCDQCRTGVTKRRIQVIDRKRTHRQRYPSMREQLVTAYARGREEGWRAGYAARGDEIVTGDAQ
jgi:hypothetical protein